MESTYQKIIRKTGVKPSSCKCQLCKSQCMKSPCLGTPEDMAKIIRAGFGDRLAAGDWGAGKRMGVIDKTVDILLPRYDDQKKACTFFTNGLCELHQLGLKPTDGKLSHHSQGTDFNPKKSIAWAVAKEWIQYWKDRPQIDSSSLSTEDMIKITNHEINTL